MTKNFYCLEDDANDLKFLIASKVRMNIIISLHSGPKKFNELNQITGIASTTIAHSLKEMEMKKWIYRKGNISYLTPTGKIIALNLIKLMKKFDTFKQQSIFWKNHKLDAIPENLQKNIDNLRETFLVEATLDNLDKPFTKYLNLLSDANIMNAVLSICFSGHTDAIHNILIKGCHVKLIVAEDIFKQFIGQFDSSIIKNFIEKGNLEIWISSELLEINCVVSDTFICIGLFQENGVYDNSRLLMGHHRDSLDWGNELFQYYKKKSNLMDIKTI